MACTPQGGTTNDPVGVGSGSSSDASLNIQVSLTDAKGVVSRDNTFATKADVWMQVQALQTGTQVQAADYLFEVVDLNGKVVSTDDLSCRRFHVTASGAIDRVIPATDASGAQCAHATATVQVNGANAMIIQLIPFDDVKKDANGAMQYKVLVAPADLCVNGVFPQTSLEVAFTIKAASATCGNGTLESGEECDDGANNGMSTDSCGTDCKLHACGSGSGAPVCGNGVVEAGEECDDGAANGTNGDACTSQCHATHLCCCGDGVVEPGEACDEGANNGAAGGTCSDTCQLTGAGSGSGSGSGSGHDH
jgi:cysteine-rich repeat protein